MYDMYIFFYYSVGKEELFYFILYNVNAHVGAYALILSFLHLLRILVLTSIENLIIFVVTTIGYIHMWMFCMLYVYMHVFDYVCVCVCLYVYQRVRAPVFLYVCVPVCVLIYVCMYHVCVCIQECARVHVCVYFSH